MLPQVGARTSARGAGAARVVHHSRGALGGQRAPVDPDRGHGDTAARVQHISRRVYKTLELSGYARIDLRLDSDGRVHVLEANPNPQIARAEDFAQSAEAAGLPYPQLLQRILTTGLRWEPERLG